MKLDTIKFIGMFTILLCFTGGTIAWAAIPQQHIRCRGCHVNPGGGVLLTQYADNQGCIYCHSSSDSSTTYELDLGGGMGQKVTVPVVVYTGTSAPTSYLSGGNFWWVATEDGEHINDTKGHNIFADNPDDNWSSAPGVASGSSCGANSCHDNLDREATAMSNRSGCLGCHMVGGPPTEFGASPGTDPKGYHHADDTNTVVGSQTDDQDGYYRFLSGHQGGAGLGVCGIEDADWQASKDSGDHNEYLGYSGTKTSAGSLSHLGHTVTGFCSGCHGNFHIEQDGAGDWIRHASDARLCPDGLDGCECAGFTTYAPSVPVARPNLDGWTQPSETVDPETDMAMCLSCHRAHGSPYPKMLRWDMTDMTGKACTTCHTSLKK